MPDIEYQRRGLVAATVGCVMISSVLVVAALVLLFKPQFGGLVGPWFLPIMSVAVILGGLLMMIGGWTLRHRKSWQWIALLVWGAIALTAPAFGFMFMLPLGLLALTSPLIIAALIMLWSVGL